MMIFNGQIPIISYISFLYSNPPADPIRTRGTGCHFYNNSHGISCGLMANVYVRNSRFERNGFK